jgi:hypothetical protein
LLSQFQQQVFLKKSEYVTGSTDKAGFAGENTLKGGYGLPLFF